MLDCIFCKIVKGEIPAKKVYEDDIFMLIEDIKPSAKIHYLAIPKSHYSKFSDAKGKDIDNIGYIFNKVSTMKSEIGLTDGFRMIINEGKNGNQSVFHVHIHILGGQEIRFNEFDGN